MPKSSGDRVALEAAGHVTADGKQYSATAETTALVESIRDSCSPSRRRRRRQR
jgi:hypothetical protein